MQIFKNGFDSAIKSLSNTVEELTKKGKIREAKMKNNLESLTEEAQQVKDKISSKMQLLIDAEIDEDTETQGGINKELEALKAKLDSIEAKISVYKSNLEFPGLSDGEIAKIRSTVMKARQERQQKVVDINDQIQQLSNQIQEIRNQIKKLDEEKFIAEQPKEAFIAKPVMGYVHPEFRDGKYDTQLGNYQYVFKNWITGQDI